ncbi:DUF1636 family protein [Aestuariivita sp.]|jgi:predicted metal-binding protein|uniref:DUF1636 family protein n=1 Tax=Aestuariivita sp. TaxID=1872407 RepID=UPI00216E8E79|nr:DUF1636 family protein [Aestuariivita sp.]MCE8009629.1 DUF1636 family protein [Aestuariivita sp.]
MSRPIVRLCSTCEPAGAEAARVALTEALVVAGLDAAVVDQACMSACSNPVSLSLQADGRATYFFAGVDPQDDLADIVGTVRAYLDSPAGWIEDARPCGRLRHCLVGRVPALSPGS